MSLKRTALSLSFHIIINPIRNAKNCWLICTLYLICLSFFIKKNTRVCLRIFWSLIKDNYWRLALLYASCLLLNLDTIESICVLMNVSKAFIQLIISASVLICNLAIESDRWWWWTEGNYRLSRCFQFRGRFSLIVIRIVGIYVKIFKRLFFLLQNSGKLHWVCVIFRYSLTFSHWVFFVIGESNWLSSWLVSELLLAALDVLFSFFENSLVL